MESSSAFSIFIGRKDIMGKPCVKNDLLHFIYENKSMKIFLHMDLEKEKFKSKTCQLRVRCLANCWENIWLISVKVKSKDFLCR